MSLGSTFIGDPFGEEQNETQIFGVDIREDRSIFPFEKLSNSAPCKSSNVSFMKVEDIHKDVRNIVGVASSSYITYSVTQKRNLLRAIDTKTGEKIILRGHESTILDVQISPVDTAFFCTVDCGVSAIAAHVVVWKRDPAVEKIQFLHAAELFVPAAIVRAHPLQSSVWAITDKHNIAVFSALNLETKVTNYRDLSAHSTVDGESITDMVFSSNGRNLVCAINGAEEGAYVQVFALMRGVTNDPESDLVCGTESLHKIFVDYHTILRVPALLAVHVARDALVTIARNDQCLLDNDEIAYEFKVWKHDALSASLSTPFAVATSSPLFTQSVVVGLPPFAWRAKMPSSSLLNPALEVAVTTDKLGNFLILSSRKSAYGAYLAIAPSSATLPFYHVSLLNLKAPVVSLQAAVILGRDHHSAEKKEQIELSVFQEEATADLQASVQLYYTPTASLTQNYTQFLSQSSRSPSASTSARITPSAATPPPVAAQEPLPFETTTMSSKGTSSILNMLKGAAGTPSSTSFPPFLSTAPAPAPSVSAKNELDFTPAVMTVDKAGLDELSLSASLSTASASNVTAPSSAPVAATPSTGIEGLKKIEAKSLFGAKSAAATPTPASPAVPAVAPVTATAPALRTIVPVPDDLPDFLRQQPSGSAKFMSLLRGASTTSVAPTPSNVPQPLETPALSLSLSPVVKEEEKKAVPSVSVTSEPSPVVPVEPAVVPVTPVPVSLPVPAAVPVAVPASVPAVPAPAPVVVAPTDLSPVLALLQSMQKDMQNMRTAHQRELQAAKDELLAQSRAQQAKTVDAVVKALKSYVDVENKKIIATVETSKIELASQLNDTLHNKVLPVLTQKLRESTQNAVKETVKTTLSDSFRTAFESSLLPAFQAGIDRLFAQVNGSFEQGMKGLSEEVLLIHQEHMQSHETIEQEIQNLRDDVQALHENVGEVSAKIEQGAVAAAAKEQVVKATPMELLKQGKISEAIRAALEAREIDDTVALLAQLTPQQVNSNCSNIVRLCLAQQLAVEMSQHMPKEGLAARIQWIKNLVMSLVRIPPSEVAADAVLSKNFKVMIQAVLESMQAARSLIEKAHFDDGEEQTVEIPQSVEVDLELLECVIQNKMQMY